MSRLVQMRWPDGLAERVDAVAGPRGRSAFVVRALEEALGGSRVGTPGRSVDASGVKDLPKGPLFGPDAPAPPPRASAAKKPPVKTAPSTVAKTYRVSDPVPVPVEFGRRGGKRPGGFVPRPKKGGS